MFLIPFESCCVLDRGLPVGLVVELEATVLHCCTAVR